MKINFKYFILVFSLLIFIQSTYSLECSPDGMVVGLEVSLDDNSFTSDFDGNSGIIYRLKFNNILGKYELWQTNNLPKRNDLGSNILYAGYGMNPATNLVDSNDLGNFLKINTSLYNRLYVKEIIKNTGSCEDYLYQTLKHYSYLVNVGGSGNTIQLYDFGIGSSYIDINQEHIEIRSIYIKDFYSGELRVNSWIRKGSSPYYPTFQMFYIRMWFDGGNVEIPKVTRNTLDYISSPLIEGQVRSINYTIKNPSPTDYKNVTFDLRTWSGDANPSLNVYPVYYENIKIGKITLAPLETYIYQYDYIIPYEKNNLGLNVYRAQEFLNYVDDPILGSRFLIMAWPQIGSLNHSYLATDIQKETFVQGTTNEGIPYIGANYLLREYNYYYNTGVNPGDYDYEILLYKKNLSSSWINFYTNRTTFNEILNPNQYIKKNLIYPLYDFENWVDYTVRLDMQTYWNFKNWRFFYDTTLRGNFEIDLDFSHLLMSTDLPLYIYPNLGSTDVYVRDVLFNLKDYILRNVSLDIDVIDPLSGISSDNFNIINPTNFDVPAQASYPVPINIKYLGPNQDKRYTIMINYSYYDEINNKNKSKMLYGDIYIKSDLISTNYTDLIPIILNYDNLYKNKNSNIKVMFENNGNSPINSSHKVSLYYKNLSESSFHLIDSKTVLANSNSAEFNFIPTQNGKIILKAVIDENNVINENSPYSLNGENNNEIASITIVRDIDLVLERARPLYSQFTSDGIIPFEIVVRNKGVGGVDEFVIDLNISWEENYWYFNNTFYNIPEEGRTFIYYWNVTNVTPGFHLYSSKVIPLYDKDYSNNIKNGGMDFCPLPWEGSSIIDCFDLCSQSCINPITKRFKKSCDNIGGCQFYNTTIANLCDGGFENTYVEFNKTHEALCPDASIIKLKQFTNNSINITGNCTYIIIKNKPVLLRGESIIMKIINCIN